jgi:hypothetical protein
MFTVEEVRDLVSYAQTVVFDAVQSTLKPHREEEFEEISVRMLRRFAKLLIYPDLILKENPRGETRVRYRSLTIQDREQLFKLLGNRSRDTMSLSDEELMRATLKQIRSYR